nr:MAG: glycosyltransferase [Hyphomicrobiales bacterium]
MKETGVDPKPCAIAIFAKAPLEGFAKTRLIPRLGAAGAAELQQRLVIRAVETAIAAALGPVSLWCAPDCSHRFFHEIAKEHSLVLHAQTGKDLGARMQNAFAQLTTAMPVLLMGSDCVVLEAELLKECAQALQDGEDAVFLPVEAGGYILVRLRAPVPELFRDMPWTTQRVMQETRRRAAALGLKIAEPKLLWDIDTPEDYERAVKCGAL